MPELYRGLLAALRFWIWFNWICLQTATLPRYSMVIPLPKCKIGT